MAQALDAVDDREQPPDDEDANRRQQRPVSSGPARSPRGGGRRQGVGRGAPRYTTGPRCRCRRWNGWSRRASPPSRSAPRPRPWLPRPAGSPRPRRPQCGRLPPRCGSSHPSIHGPLPGRLPYRPYHHGTCPSYRRVAARQPDRGQRRGAGWSTSGPTGGGPGPTAWHVDQSSGAQGGGRHRLRRCGGHLHAGAAASGSACAGSQRAPPGEHLRGGTVNVLRSILQAQQRRIDQGH
jgi:hypothetical protein